MAIITIARECCSHGAEVAEKVADMLGYECVSREILLEAAYFFNIPEQKLLHSIHDAPSVLERITHGREKYIAYIRAALLEHVKKDNIVYHGYAGHLLIPEITHVLKIRLFAAESDRVAFLQNEQKMSREEALRYEKNYFLYTETKNLENAISYVHQAEQKLVKIIENYSRYTIDKNLETKLHNLRQYEEALSALLLLHQNKGSSATNPDLSETFAARQEAIRILARDITGDMEKILNEERRYVNQLIQESKIYHLLALAGILALSVLTVLFFIFNVNRPLKSIETGIQKIVEGDYNNIPAISSGDEFESLVASLNTMISELNKRSEQLVQREKMASLGILTSGVAHELNNPLNNISTSVQILLEELEDTDLEYKKELLTQTEAQIQRARDIVRALLEFSREKYFKRKKVKLADLVENTLKLIKGEIPTNVQLTVEIPADIQGEMDPRRIEQVLINLVLNGIQAMEAGGILSIRDCAKEGEDEFCFEVSDTGKGIPPQDLGKIFDPFFTTKDVGKGSGLGLSVSHGIIKQHGGRIE